MSGHWRRGAFGVELIRRALDDARRWDDIEATVGSIADEGHGWDDDPGEVGVGSRLVTGNPKDVPMRELDVEHWPVGV